MKLLKSKCEKVWLFDAAKYDEEITAGLACFLPWCADFVEIEIKSAFYQVAVPRKAIQSPVPVKVRNARLSLLIPILQ